jgi:deoxyribodipyrimidine photo-lyase
MPIIHWFRRDLRLFDNTALFNAARDARDGVIPIFIFDPAILKHPDCGGAIVQFMLGCLEELRASLQKLGGDLLLLHGKPIRQLLELAKKTGASAVYFNKDYDPKAIERDVEVERRLPKSGIEVKAFKDLVVFEEREILAASSGEPYTVYSPYRRAWMERLKKTPPAPGLPVPRLQFFPVSGGIAMPTVQSLGFEPIENLQISPGESAARKMLKRFASAAIKRYPKTRNFPADETGSSRLSAHLRHGTLSIRAAVAAAQKEAADVWLGELIWREFYQQILFNFPDVAGNAFKTKFRKLPWRKDKKELEAWMWGKTGFPIVDAGMRQLNQTGWMHNRVRMIVAMFLTKDLRIDYRLGERYFANRLIDHEVAQNNGNWQWSASTGTDAQPWFRIFNPASQSKSYDPKGVYIRRWVKELSPVPEKYIHEPHTMPAEMQARVGCLIGRDYPLPMVDHAEARKETLGMFKGTQ